MFRVHFFEQGVFYSVFFSLYLATFRNLQAAWLQLSFWRHCCGIISASLDTLTNSKPQRGKPCQIQFVSFIATFFRRFLACNLYLCPRMLWGCISTTLYWKAEICWCLQAILDPFETKAAFELLSFHSRGDRIKLLIRLLIPHALLLPMSYIEQHKRRNPKAEKKPAWHEYNRALLEPRLETYFLTFFSHSLFALLSSSTLCGLHFSFPIQLNCSNRRKNSVYTRFFFTVNQSYVMKASPFCVSVLSELEKRTFYIFDLASFRCKSRNSSRLIMETVTDCEVLVIVWKRWYEISYCTSNSPICLPSIKYDIIKAMIPAWNGFGVSYQRSQRTA